MSRVLVISFSDLGSDPRVDRQIAAIRAEHNVVAAGLSPPRDAGVEFIELPAAARSVAGRVLGLIRLLARRYEAVYWRHPTNRAALTRLERVGADVIVANDLSALPLARRLGAPVVFDAHEYAPEEFADRMWWRLLLKPYVLWQCRRSIPGVASMLTVSSGIADQYERDTGVRAEVVLNAPPYHELSPSQVHDPIRILHHGVAQRGRGLEEMIRLARLLDDRFTVDFVLVDGDPGYREHLIALSGGNPKVRFPAPVPMEELVEMANAYDIGLFLIPPRNLNGLYVLPNKFFEFVQARLAVAIGPSPEMERLVRSYGLGVVAGDFEATTLAAALNALDREAVASFKRAAHAAARALAGEASAALVLRAVETAVGRATRFS